MSMWLMYLILMLDNFQVALGLGCFAAFLTVGLFQFCAFFIFHESWEKEEDKKEYKQKCKKLRKWWAVSFLILALAIFLPDTQTAATLYVLPKVINNKQIQKMPNKLVMLANSWMDKQIKSIKKAGK